MAQTLPRAGAVDQRRLVHADRDHHQRGKGKDDDEGRPLPKVGHDDRGPGKPGRREKRQRCRDQAEIEKDSVEQAAGRREDQLPRDADHDRRRHQRQEDEAGQEAAGPEQGREEKRNGDPQRELGHGRAEREEDAPQDRRLKERIEDDGYDLFQSDESAKRLAERALAPGEGDEEKRRIDGRDQEADDDRRHPEGAGGRRQSRSPGRIGHGFFGWRCQARGNRECHLALRHRHCQNHEALPARAGARVGKAVCKRGAHAALMMAVQAACASLIACSGVLVRAKTRASSSVSALSS